MTAEISSVLLMIVGHVNRLRPIPLGLLGTWVILLGILAYGRFTDFAT